MIKKPNGLCANALFKFRLNYTAFNTKGTKMQKKIMSEHTKKLLSEATKRQFSSEEAKRQAAIKTTEFFEQIESIMMATMSLELG